MILKNMTLPEIKRALIFDYETEIKSVINRIHFQHKADWIRCKRKVSLKTVYHETKNRNTWRLIVETNEYNNTIMPYVCFYDVVGIKAFHLSSRLAPQAFLYFNTHFFKRFRERMKLDIEKPEEVIKYFIKKNFFLLPHAQEGEEGKGRVFTQLTGGLGLGIYHAQEEIFEFKTFVDNSLLGDEQKKRLEEILLENYNKFIKAYQENLPRLAHKIRMGQLR